MSWFREQGFQRVVENTIPALGGGGFGIVGQR
jgi:hypothetical protein